jgi:hypothetical protein
MHALSIRGNIPCEARTQVMDEKAWWLALHLVPGVGRITFKKLVGITPGKWRSGKNN